MTRSRLSFLSLLIVTTLSLAACKEDEHNSQLMRAANFGGMTLQSSESTSFDASNAVDKLVANVAEPTIMDRSKLGDRKVAETHTFDIELQPDQLQSRIMGDYKSCQSLGCEILGSNVHSGKSGYLHARIAPENLAAFFKTIESAPGEVKQHQAALLDETNAYVDTSAQLKNQIALRDRLTTLLQSEKTKSVSDVMQIERELTRVQQQIDSATSRMNALEKRTGMATVNISYEVPYFQRQDHYDGIKTSFSRAWRGFVSNLDSVIVFVGQALPWIPVILIGLWLFVKVISSRASGGFGFFRRKKKGQTEG